MELKNKKILVTGGAGFIGSHLVDALIERGAKVVCLDNLVTGRMENVNKRAEFYKTDINDPELEEVFKKEKPEVVFALAFNTIVPKSVKDPMFDVMGLTGTLNTIVLADKYSCQKFVFTSSGFVYGNPRVFPTPETEPVVPDNPYIISKFAIENYLNFFNRIHGLDYVVLRFGTVYGPRQTHGALADYMRCIHSGKKAEIYGDGTKTRDYVFIADAVEALLKSVDYSFENGILSVFNIATGVETKLKEAYSEIAAAMEKPQSAPEYKPDRLGEIHNFCLARDKARKYLAWEPKTDFQAGIAKTVEYFLKNDSG